MASNSLPGQRTQARHAKIFRTRGATMAQFLYRLRPTRLEMLTDGPTPDEARSIGDHFHYLQGLLATEVLLMAGRTLNSDESTFGIVVIDVASERDARQVSSNDPAVKSGVMRAELFPFRVALWSTQTRAAE
jgi:uncharacterized protein YciI